MSRKRGNTCFANETQTKRGCRLKQKIVQLSVMLPLFTGLMLHESNVDLLLNICFVLKKR